MTENEIAVQIEFLQNVIKHCNGALNVNEILLNKILPVLESIRELLKDKDNRNLLNAAHWDVLEEFFVRLAPVDHSIFTSNDITLITEIFRLFRNACAGSLHNQNLIIRSGNLIKCTASLFKIMLDKDSGSCSDKVSVCLRCCLQFMGNLVVNNEDAQGTLWTLYQDVDAFSTLLRSPDDKVKEYSTMILYNCLTPLHRKHLISSEKGHTVINLIITSVIQDSSDWSLLCLEKLIEEKCFMTELYDSLPLQNRFFILDLIAENLSKLKDQNQFTIPPSAISHIALQFKNNAMNIVKLCSPQHKTLEPVEIVKFLSVLCKASANENYHIFKEEFDLLETTVDVLKSIHFIGKSDGNVFSPVQSLKAESEVGEIESHSAYGFKRDLIRLIGNLAAQCKENQDKVRNLDGIPLLLDCCNIDSRNPYIMQWCILAIRNLLDKNPENQAVVASISVTGDLVNSPLLKELGFVVENHQGHLVLRTDASVEKSISNVN